MVPYEDFTDYTAEDFIEDHATTTTAEEEEARADPSNYVEDDEDDDDDDGSEPRAKRFRGDIDSYDNEGSQDYDARYERDGPGIPSLMNLNLHIPRHGHDTRSTSEKSPNGPWESSSTNQGNGGFGNNQNNSNNNKSSGNKDRRTRGSRWR